MRESYFSVCFRGESIPEGDSGASICSSYLISSLVFKHSPLLAESLLFFIVGKVYPVISPRGEEDLLRLSLLPLLKLLISIAPVSAMAAPSCGEAKSTSGY